jgi:lipoprotein-anchoring transpeptidase ErfK/SrfK
MRKLVSMLAGIVLTVGLTATTAVADPAGAVEPPARPAASHQVSGTMVTASSTSQARLPRRCKTKGRVLCVDKTRRKLYYVEHGKILKTMAARFGCARTPTRQGTFKVHRKNRHWTSTLYHSSMPFSMFFSGGQAVHYSADFHRRGYAGCSHGCVNIRSWSKIKWVFAHIKVGDRVVVYRS